MQFGTSTNFEYDFEKRQLVIIDNGFYRHVEAGVILSNVIGRELKFEIMHNLCTPDTIVMEFEEESSLEIAKLCLSGV
jgi:hypothetical protein